ncbi:hypothetical protein [Mycobacterium aquaticum]|uniref:Exonuclease domain-containing protein n=1 Tax=Mycobacterium aquaticum TaxID=1927124 RepID=A0A1X0A004_9MYCO|nr:hypothetical protein [Mycobacterium aquaticum]ORA23427.1 hypothetical protein BST13_35335 [Mycobacterium aquaticum]
MGDIVFMDTETLGLDLDSPIWEFAAVRRDGETGREYPLHLFVEHDPQPWLDTLPAEFAQDYAARYDHDRAVGINAAAGMITMFLEGRPTIIGAVPDFDTARIRHQMLRPNGIQDPWHYHLIDIENVIVGWARGIATPTWPEFWPMTMLPPYSSDELSAAVGVNPEDFDRHTAMGDVEWVRAQWDAVMSGAR